ncbi:MULTISPECIES: MarR family winged helix-turn-helix transcriptional regulator [unclassified Ketobacter]|uniref:MarR family winged helix-turn-helix transcriptional regulator n=1 Tax=unclassified Ketobacter TaxID=2639109 RepID=UPI0025BE2D64|nr:MULTISPECIES: helix-turn-helix domain-containing protein [unclassified Ketobacter]
MIKITDKNINPETNDLIVEVFRLNGLLLATADKLVSKFGLTGARWQVLGAIAKVGVPETTARLARNMGLTRQSVQRVVNEMVAEGMLTLEENPHHKRSKLVVMTAKGEKAFQQAIDLQGPWVKALSEGISKKRLKEAKEVLTIIGSRLSNDGS